MNVSDYLFYLPYKVLWYINDFLGKTSGVAFYCADPLDYEMFKPIQKHLPHQIRLVVLGKKTKEFLRVKGIPFSLFPIFPRAVIMARHHPYKFPVKKIVKIGFDHGLYQFKRWTSAKYYNDFDIYFVSSEQQVKLAKKRGITTTKAIGYPKLDPAFDGTYDKRFRENLIEKLKLDKSKKTILFSTTWNVGLSALPRWIDHFHMLTDTYNVLLTVHTWIAETDKQKLKRVPGSIFLEELNVVKYIAISDVCIGDYSSIIGEYCALNKPIITFKVLENNWTIPAVLSMISSISHQINTFDELPTTIEHVLKNKKSKEDGRKKANLILFNKLDGLAGRRAANDIISLLQKKQITN